MTGRRDTDLTAPIKRLLAVILGGQGVIALAGNWQSADGKLRFHRGTVEAAYERRLIAVTVESRHRTRHAAKLTEIGRHVASDLHREGINRNMRFGEKPVVSPAAQRLITELVDAA